MVVWREMEVVGAWVSVMRMMSAPSERAARRESLSVVKP
jgi:hypothetical protein